MSHMEVGVEQGWEGGRGAGNMGHTEMGVEAKWAMLRWVWR